MKTETTAQDLKESARIAVDPGLEKIFAGKILFPEKLAQANDFIEKHPLPDKFKKEKQ